MKTVLITGATDGIGRETARQLLSQGFRVLVHGRTLEKAQRVVVEFQHAQPDAAAEAVYADLARMPAVVAGPPGWRPSSTTGGSFSKRLSASRRAVRWRERRLGQGIDR